MDSTAQSPFWGARPTDSGTDFALATAPAAERVEVCLVDHETWEQRCFDLARTGTTAGEQAVRWEGTVPGCAPGQHYGYRVHGPWDPGRGLRFNPSKLLLDPHSLAVSGRTEWGQQMHAYVFGDPATMDTSDSLGHSTLSVVVDHAEYDWEGDAHPRTPYNETVIYEAHLKGLTQLHPEVPEACRGTYAGAAHPAVVRHLAELGVTAVELMPVHQFVHDSTLLEKGLVNYWGYNTVCFFAPHAAYSSSGDHGQQIYEFKELVKAYHRAGIEVILDVVYNHTAEGNHLGPQLSYRGIDNAAYYHLVPGNEFYYMDYTGTGNSLNVGHPLTLQLVLDSLRYWVTEMHVDGFRFDLAATLAREEGTVDMVSPFFGLVAADPVLSRTKLIAEPWDVGPGGYQVGNFPPQWTEWNGRFRDTVRDFWRGQPGTLRELAMRVAGSADLYEDEGRKPSASINFVTAHDGFTLADLVSYDGKHNEANGEGNRDGADDNRSWNCGAEGPTADPGILELRARQQRNLLLTLMLSQGVPMLSHGDELGRTQSGNNNAYCQDNATTWIDWEHVDSSLLDFTRRLLRLRADHPVFRRRHFFDGCPVDPAEGDPLPDIAWIDADGSSMGDADWDEDWAKSLAFFLNGNAVPSHGRAPGDSDFLVILNAAENDVDYHIPDGPFPQKWSTVLTTCAEHLVGETTAANEVFTVPARSAVVLEAAREE
ncbi:glycogen operon protein GlgX homolog [Sinomonas cellulolyticus]|uniref:Glycogen debranching protein GlgX n=1 Tax=Sinomonas cellulolyticus TaxID=2801916 RepID=A0ABS1JZD4_9MICC|nr:MULTISPECIES: glycogen debranching protein GlgX [Sinomonas]MBL0704705.1 glycogen debranching protein GlgX [Sinomonas cellulolyticus]GHG46577.1 glycogen operon protein GlgX homolog [Sinomonas sp. KCTC 49339]